MRPSKLKIWAAALREQSLTVYFAARDPRTPMLVRVLALFIAAYALSPIDLIPDFIPVIGYLDDIVLIPLGVALVVRFTPQAVIDAARARAVQAAALPVSYFGAVVILLVWLTLAWLVVRWALGHE